MTGDPQISETVGSFLARPEQLLIDGKWADGTGGGIDVVNPSTGKRIATVAGSSARS